MLRKSLDGTLAYIINKTFPYNFILLHIIKLLCNYIDKRECLYEE